MPALADLANRLLGNSTAPASSITFAALDDPASEADELDQTGASQGSSKDSNSSTSIAATVGLGERAQALATPVGIKAPIVTPLVRRGAFRSWSI